MTVTRETALRRLDGSRKSLAVAVDLRPGEGIPDVLLRATAVNGFQFPYQIVQLIGGRREQRFSHFGSGKWSLSYEGLGDLLGLPHGDADIQPLLYGFSAKQQVTFFGRNLPLKQLIGHRRVAPASLRTLGYQKAVWHISSLTFDPKSYELLLDHCPVCETRLNFLVARGISFCHRCVDADNPMRPVVDLREFPQGRAQFDDEEALRFATDLVNPETSLADLAKWNIHPSLRDTDPGHLFEFMAQVARAIDFRDGRCGALEAKFSSVGEVSADALSRSARAILGWPDAFVELAESLKDTWFFPRTKDFYSHPLRVRLASPFYAKGFRKLVTSALKLSEKSTPILRRPKENSAAAIVHDVQQTWEDNFRFARASKSVRQQVEQTGLPINTLLLCYSRKGFECPDTIMRRTFGPAVHTFATINPTRRTRGRYVLSLRDIVAALFSGAGNPWPSVLEAIAQDRLPLVKLSQLPCLIDSVGVVDFKPLKNFFRENPVGCDQDGPPIIGGEAGFHLNCSIVQISNLVAARLLPSGKMPISEVWAFRRSYISPKEIACRLLMNGEFARPNIVGAELNEGGIKPIVDSVFVRSRSTVEEFYGERLRQF
ncbi:hypothetical protein [Rhizobium leguminosarum]|uniref:hypothetical protein n=1 Tax=Rhizobium leguminosarum TaxID=384 RepID=UPI00098EE685|nr:hypothetical protein [Rhizobium leguminosarum]MBB5255974.1 hypothetical protein [Rhizobium leguminosarum]MDX6001292.1 hypothetical protein [Rhizobium leguminosarum]OOO44056.1 hypothetical protein BS629_28275 [Rhizobium leguminosarum bv. viciae USDA 2370]PUB63209.1 hypothetical protein DB728_15985 [Rhizobium leguminosarum bv. viciae USDA 2370]